MEYLITLLFTLSATLFIASFFAKERSKEVDTQIENFSITLMQEIYQLKKKIKVLEEEILIGEDERYFTKRSKVEGYNRDKILDLYEQGHSIKEIIDITGLSADKIDELLSEV